MPTRNFTFLIPFRSINFLAAVTAGRIVSNPKTLLTDLLITMPFIPEITDKEDTLIFIVNVFYYEIQI